VPIPDESLFHNVIKKLNNETYIVTPPVMHILAMTISTDNTVIWYDHWEDGFEKDVTVTFANTTRVSGDGNAANGCAPTVVSCTNAADKLKAGNAIVIRNNVTIPRNPKQIVFDGGDRIQASYPITVTRAGHPFQTAVLASAIQAMDVSQWGTSYEAPVGVDYGKTFPAFEWSIFMYQAGADGTSITLPNMTNVTLNMGESGFYVVNQGDTITADKPIQVILVTGDIDLSRTQSKP
jgi:IgGFc binding protein